jgi:macrolide transport system ATP-binding/permease protein
VTLLHRLASVVRWMVYRDRAERDLNDELEAFVDMAAADKMRDGAAPAEARRSALLHLGGVEQAKERVRSARHGAWLDELGRDVRYALRMCRRNPGFSAVVVATLAIGIGANTAVFSVVDAVLLRPLTYAEPERLVVVHETLPTRGRVPVGAFEFEEWRRAAQSFEHMSLMAVAPVVLTRAGDPERLDAARVSASLFPMLGIEAAIGRTFSPEAEVLGRHHVAVLSDGLWRTRFGADASIVGRTITLNDESYVVSGVLPPGFRFPRLEQIFVMGISGGQPQVWLPFAITDAERGENSFATIAKLKDGVSPEQARAEVTAILREVVQRIPNPPPIGVEVIPLQEQITGASRDVLALLWAAIAAVLVIACANIANLMLSRSAARGHELAIRGALGASRRTLLRHSLLDSITLAVLGGVCGVVLAISMLPLLLRLAPPSVARLDEVTLEGRALLFAAMVTLATGLVVGLFPARRAARTDLIESLRVTARTASLGGRDADLRRVMVAAQIAVTLACLTAAGLVIQSLRNVLRVDPGFTTEGILTVDVSLSPGRYGNRDTRAAFVRQALQHIESITGVTSAGFVNRLPFSGISMNSVLVAEGTERAAIPMTERPLADVRSVDAGYFRTLGIPLLRGELFQETAANRAVAVVSAAMASRAWPGESAIGKRFRLSAQPNRLVEVIGVAGDVRNMGFEAGQSSTVYLPYWQGFLNATSFVVRTRTDPTAAASAVRAAISVVDSDVPIDSMSTMQGIVAESVDARTFQVTLLTLFGAIAMALSGIGVFGVMSYAVAQRAKEFGIRLALGATPLSLQQMVVGNAVRLVSTGVALGLPLAVAAAYFMRDLLFGIDPRDLGVLVSSSAVIFLVGLIAGWIPAHHATQTDPIATLRVE